MDKNDKRLLNLRPAQKGERRNPTGMNASTKRRMQLQEIGMRVLGRMVDITIGGKAIKASGVEAIWIAMRNEAIKGDVGAATWCRDTAYGKPVQAITGDLNVMTGGISEAVQRANGELGKDDKAGG